MELEHLFNSALHVSGDKFAHPQEHFLTVYTAFGTLHWHCCWPVPRLRWNWKCWRTVPKAVHTVKKCCWGWANLSPETCRAELKKINKRKSCCILLVIYIVALKMFSPRKLQIHFFLLLLNNVTSYLSKYTQFPETVLGQRQSKQCNEEAIKHSSYIKVIQSCSQFTRTIIWMLGNSWSLSLSNIWDGVHSLTYLFEDVVSVSFSGRKFWMTDVYLTWKMKNSAMILHISVQNHPKTKN